jgi:hypothetical protein
MAPDRSTQITGLLRAWRSGDQAALDLLAVKVYDELRRRARRYMRNERAGNILDWEEEIVVALKISLSTVRRDWSLARAWLLQELSHPIREPSEG